MAIQDLIKGEPDWHLKINSNNTEYSNKIGDLTTSTNTNKSSVVAITNELNASLSDKAKQTDLAQLSNPNILINGDFQVWQRGTSFTAPTENTYLADRWKFSVYGSLVNPNSYCAVTKVNDGLSLVCTGATGAGNTIWSQAFESDTVKKLLGKTVTLSFSVKYTNITQISVAFNTTSTSGFENPNQLTSTAGTSSDYVRYSVTFTVPKTASVFIPQILLSVPSGTSSYILKDVKLELGSIATPFVPRPYGEELVLCQRYYNRFSNLAYQLLALQDGGGNYRSTATVTFPKMRIAPTLTLTSLTGTVNKVTIGDSGIYTGDPANIDSSINSTNSTLIDTAFIIALHNSVFHYFKFNIILDAEIYS